MRLWPKRTVRPDVGRRRGFISLRAKLVWFISLVIIGICSALSWYFVQQQNQSMKAGLLNTGTILVQNLGHNSRYGIYTERQALLDQFVDGAMEAEEVVYIVIRGPEPERKVLIQKAKDRPYPDPSIAEDLFKTQAANVSVTDFPASGEVLYDFGLPVLRTPSEPVVPGFGLEPAEPQTEGRQVYGTVQIGLSDALMRHRLNEIILKVVLITLLIILGGIAATVLLAGQIIRPLKSLATVATRVAEGDLTATVEPSTQDEVGQLTSIFNHMTASLKTRDTAIAEQIETITKQVKQLAALNLTGAAITSTLDLDKLLSVVLNLLVGNMDFTRMRLVLYDADRQIAYGSRMVGVAEQVERAWREVELQVPNDEGYLADLLIRGKPLLVSDVNTVRDRMVSFNLTPAEQVGITSFVAAPLKTKGRILGYIAADKGAKVCTRDDLDLLMTVASYVAVAVDNARAYHELEQLTLTLEQRVQSRTQELQAANQKLQELDLLKSAFVSVVSHELRTPMTSIKGYIESMLKGVTGVLNEKQSYYLSRVKYNVERLTRMINDLLDLSRIEAGRVEIQIASVSLTEVITEVIEGIQVMAQEKGVTVRQQYLDGMPMVLGDRDLLHQILTNLIQNAIKFTPNGGEIQVETAAYDENFLQVCIADTGCGISPEEVDKVFDKFFRGKSVPTEARGAGLGLAITKSLVELHHGRIWVDSAVGQGSRFCFTVPIARR